MKGKTLCPAHSCYCYFVGSSIETFHLAGPHCRYFTKTLSTSHDLFYNKDSYKLFLISVNTAAMVNIFLRHNINKKGL